MRQHVKKALDNLEKLDTGQLHGIIADLQYCNKQLENVLSSIPGAVIVSDPEHRIMIINNPARRLFPLSTQSPVELKTWEVISSKELASFIQSALERDLGAPEKDFSIRIRRRRFTLRCAVLPLVDNKRIVGSVVYGEDVTNKREEERRLKRIESLAQLSTLTAGVAHEIKNPLGSMSIHLQLMRRQLNSDSADKRELLEFLDIIDEETERLNTIVSDYLFAVRPPAAQPRMADLNALIADIVQFMHFETDQAGVRVTLLCDKTLPQFPLDEGAIKRAMLNLIKNAVIAMPNGGDLSIQTKREDLLVHIDISDTGVGIPSDLQGKIFEPYFTTRDTGSGLGLTVVYKAVKEHGGDLRVDSLPGQGTTFRMTLPLPIREKRLLSGAS